MSSSLRFDLASGPLWIPRSDAARILGMTRQGVGYLVSEGVVRARRDGSNLFIFRDDVLYVHTCREESGEDARSQKYEHLTDRLPFPLDLRGQSGIEVAQWAKGNGREDLLQSKIMLPPTISVPDSETGVRSDKALTAVSLRDRLDHLERLVQALLSSNGVDVKLSRMSSADCRGLLVECSTALSKDLDRAEIMKLSRVLIGLDSYHITQAKSWAANHPGEAREILENPQLPYRCIYLLGLRLEQLARGLPGADLANSMHAQVLSMAVRARKNVEVLCSNQAGVDLLLRKDAGKYLPAPLTPIDQFILGEICGRS